MITAPPVEHSLQWVDTCTAMFCLAVAHCDDDDFAAPSALPTWTRAAVVAHVGLNAQALNRLVHWATTGDQTAMYASREHRDAEIRDGAAWSPQRLRQFLWDTAAEIRGGLGSLVPDHLQAEVTTVDGTPMPASTLPWLRAREVAIHGVDLDAGVEFEDLPSDFCLALCNDVLTRRRALGRDPGVSVRSTDGRVHAVLGNSASAPVAVGDVAALARWLTGRGEAAVASDDGSPLPTLSPWL